ncbi:hypothetical protein C5167_007601 [Papaver somniferum]|nr:hypothetical protein C5167_007601 [Papaver somniferum]
MLPLGCVMELWLQTTAMANRTVIVDNNTWNNTHVATAGTANSSPAKASNSNHAEFPRVQTLILQICGDGWQKFYVRVRRIEIRKKHFIVTHIRGGPHQTPLYGAAVQIKTS